MSVELSIGNAVCISYFLDEVPTKYIKSVMLTAFDFSLIVLAVVLLLRTRATSEQLEKLAWLERDIVFHGLPENEIKRRIQYEFIGYEVGDWLAEKVIEVREKAKLLDEHANRAEQFCEEFKRLDVDLKFERRGRVNEFLDELDTRVDHYIAESSKLLKWLLFVKSGRGGKHEEYVAKIIDDVVSELEQISDDARDKTMKATEKLRNAVQNDA